MACKDDWILVNDMPTRFLTWGTWVEDLKENENLVLVITGNPGIVDFYGEFLKELHTKLKMPVWAVSHVGHETPPKSKNMANCRLYNLQDQIDHKVAIIRKYVPQTSKLFVVGHSMGAKVINEMLKIPDIEERIIKGFMLFPTVERIGDTPNAQFVKPFIRYMGSTVVFFTLVFTCFPQTVRYYLLNNLFKFAYGAAPNCVVDAGMKLIQPASLRNVFHLFTNEVEEIKELDAATLNKYKKKLKFYYGTKDGWSPLKFYDNLMDKVPDIDAVVCKDGMAHAFSIKSATRMAEMISSWIQESQNTQKQ